MSTTAKIFPAGSTTVANGAWKSACSANQGYWSGDKTFSTAGGSLNFNGNAGDNNNAYKCQLKASEGVITTTITSSYGVDVEVSSKIKESGGEITISITTSGDPDTQTCTATDFTSKTVSTTSTSATLTISNTGSKVGGVQYIKITPKTASTKTLTLKLPKGDGTFEDYETTDKSKLADYDLMVSEKACYGSAAFWGGSWNSGYWTDEFIDYNDATSTQPTRYNSSSTFSTDKTLWPLFVYGSTPTYYHTDPYCPTYHVTYNGNGKTSGTLPTDNTDYDGGETVTVKSATLTKTGYTFTGWNTQDNGGGTHYAANGSATFTMPASDVTLYAEWCRDLSTLNLNSEFDLEESSVTGVSARIDWAVADATKYDWALKKGASFDGGTAVSSGSNLTADYKELSGLDPGTHYWFKLTAKNDCGATSKEKTIDFTTLNAYVITYHKNDGSGTSATESKTEGVNYTISSDKFSRDNYTLSKWNTQADGGGTNYEKGATYSTDAALTLHAVWAPKVYTVTKTFTGCSSASMPTSYTYTGTADDFSYTVTPSSGMTLPSTINITMGGSALSVGTDYTWNASTGALAISKVITGNLVITISALQLYTVTFYNAAGSAPSAVKQTTEGGTVSIPSTTACDGWTFAGWKIGSSQSSTTTDPTGSGYITSESWPKTDYVPSGNISAYAVFKKTTGGSAKTTLLTSAFDVDEEYYDEEDWPTQEATYSDTQDDVDVLRFSSKSGTGSITSKSLTAPIGTTVKVAFKIKDYGDTDTEATVSLSNCATEQTFATSSYSSLTDVEKSFTTTSTTTFTVTICASGNKKRFYITDIEVYYGGGGTTTWKSDVSCSSATLDHISITTNPTKLNYLVGDVFDPTGAVVEAYYDDDSHHTVTGDVTWTAPTGGLTAGTNQTITASYTEGGVTRTDSKNVVNVYAVDLRKRDEDGNAISGLLSDAPAVSLTLVNHLSAAEHGNKYAFKEWQVTNGSLSSTSSLTPTIDAVSGAITVTAVYYKPITVTWHVPSGVFSGPSEYLRGWETQFPSSPDPEDYGCDEKIFYGWSRTPNYSSDDTAPTDLVEAGEVLTSDEDFYAIFAVKVSDGSAPEWTKTALESVTAGTYLICTTDGKAFNGAMTSGHGQVTASAFSGAKWALSVFNEDAPTGAQEITFSTNSSGWKMYVAGEGKGYLYASKASSGGFSYQADAGEEYWSSSSSAWKYSKNYSGSYAYLRVYNSSFRTYNSSTGGDAGIVLLKKTAAGVPATYSDFSTSCTCKGFSFHTGSGTDNEVKATNTRTCFTQVDASTTWKIDNYVIPSDAKFFVGYQDEFKSSGLGTSSRSAVKQFNADEALYFEYTKSYGDGNRPSVGNATGAIGTLRIWSDNSWDNCHVGFDPNGYIFKLGSTYYSMSNSATLDPAVRFKETEIITLTSTDISGKYQVNIAAAAPNASTGVASRYTENKNLAGMGVKSGSGASWRGDGIKVSDANTKGFFRIDIGDGGATNWNAHWVPVWELTFDLKGGSGSIATTPAYVSVEAVSKVVTIPNTAPTKDGYRFLGWSDDDNSSVEYAAGSTHNVTLSGNKTVYAVWAQEFTVTYAYGTGGTGSCAGGTYIAGETVTTCNTTPSKACSTFLGWTVDNGIGDKAANTTFEMPAANVTITARWNTTTYALTYKDQGDVAYSGSNAGSLPAVHTCGETTNLPNGVRSGYRFDGWFTTSACTGVPITSIAGDGIDEPTTLYAKWTAAYTFTFSKNGVVDGTLTVGQVTGENVIMPNTTVDCGLWTTFEGWVESTVAETTTEPTVIYKPGDIYVAGSSDKEFKALYSKHEGDATVYYEKVTSGPKSGTYVMVSYPRNDIYYIYTSYNASSYCNQSPVTISDNGTVSAANATSASAREVTVRAGNGANTGKFAIYDGTASKYLTGGAGSVGVNNDITFCWNLMDGSTKVNSKEQIPKAGAIHSTTNTTYLLQLRNHSTCDRFQMYANTQTDGTNPYDVYLYRKRVAGTTYYTTAPGSCEVPTEITVSYNDNKAYAGDQTISGMPSGTTLTFTDYPDFDTYTVGSAPTDPTGYHFTGWNTSAEGGGDSYDAGEDVTTFGYVETITLYAQWERVYTVTLYDNGVERTRLTQASAGANVTLPSGNNCTPGSAFTFVGWTDSPVQLNAEPVRPNIVSGAGEWGDDELTDDITLYSVYSKSVAGCDDFAAGVSGAYKMYYDGSTYATTAGSTGSYTGATSGTAEVFYIAYAPAHTGYTIRTSTGFVGWNYDGSELTKANATPYYWKISGSSSNWVITPEPSAYTKQLKSTDGSKFQLYAAATSGKLLLQKSAMTYYYNTASCGDNSITFHDGGGTISGTPTTPTGASWNSDTHILSGLEDCDKITEFPTASYDGWTFIGWSTEDYSNNGKHTTDYVDENASTDEPDGSGIYKTDGNPYVVRGGSIDMYPIFTRFPENEPFNTTSGGDYYIYYLEPGSNDGYGALVRQYAGEYDNVKRYGRTTSCAAATEFTFTKDGDVWHIYDKTKGKYVTGKTSDDWLVLASDLSGSYDDWTITIRSGNQFDATCGVGGGRQLSFSTSANYFMNYELAATPGYPPVYLGTCTERIFSSEPNPTPTVDLTGEPMVTSSKGQTVRAAIPMTLSASHITGTSPLKVTITGTNLKFATSAAVNTDPAASLEVAVDGSGKIDPTTIYVYYTPTEDEDGIENITVTAVATKWGPTEIKRTTGIVHARHLPEDFVIATKLGDKWYALPANCTTNSSSTEGMLIEVDDVNDPTAATAAPASTKYGLRNVAPKTRKAGNGERMVFTERISTATADNQMTLYNGSSTNIQVNAMYTTYKDNDTEATREKYEWTPETSDFKDYLLTSASASRTLSMNTSGVFGSLTKDKAYSGQVRLLPATFYTPADMQVVEWKANSVVVMYTGSGVTATTKVGTNSESSAQTLTTAKVDHGVFELTTNQALISNANTQLFITIKNGSSAVVGKKALVIPAIINTDNKTADYVVSGADAAERIAKAATTDVVILDGAVLSAVATKYTYKNITVYPGGKLVIGSGNQLGMASLTLRGGSSWGAASYEHKYPQFVVNNATDGAYSNTAVKINYDYVTTKAQYYTFVLPYTGNTSTIKYPVDIYGKNLDSGSQASFEFQYYDGAARAAGGTGWATLAEPADLVAGRGYTFLGMPRKVDAYDGTDDSHSNTRQTYGIHRIPMSVTAATVQAGETNSSPGKSTPISVTLADKNNASGWVLVGNPFMGDVTGLSNEDIQVGELVHTSTVPWDGKWEWDDTNPSTGVRYVVIPYNSGTDYHSEMAEDAELPAFKNFFVQIKNGSATSLVIPASSRNDAGLAPARYVAQEVKDIRLAVDLVSDTKSDKVDFLINDTYSAAYDDDADFTKMMNGTNFNLYGVYPGDNLSFIAVDKTTAAGNIAIGYQVPAAGEYTLQLSERPYVMSDYVETLLVTDHEVDPEVTTDLLENPYTFTVTKAETNDTRFTVSIKLKENQDTPTDIDIINGGGDLDGEKPIKFIYHDKMYILRNGVLYDATGKRVKEINK